MSNVSIFFDLVALFGLVILLGLAILFGLVVVTCRMTSVPWPESKKNVAFRLCCVFGYFSSKKKAG